VTSLYLNSSLLGLGSFCGRGGEQCNAPISTTYNAAIVQILLNCDHPSNELKPPISSYFVGELYTKEIRRVSDQDCFGVSVSRLATGPDRKAVAPQVSLAAHELAHRYAARGYKFKLIKLISA